jgi:hypothetical protein
MSLPAVPLEIPEIKLDLSGDRAVEWSWVSANIPEGGGKALDFGPGGSQLSTIAAMKGYDVTGVDMLDIERPFVLPNLRFLKGDLNELPLENGSFDVIMNCSTVEHSGITGRYSITKEDEDADLKAMQKLRSLMKKTAVQLLTVPVGKDAVWRPLHRIYGEQRMPRLLSGYKVLSSRCWVKDRYNRWVLTSEKEAFARETAPEVYGLGCYKIVRDDYTG